MISGEALEITQLYVYNLWCSPWLLVATEVMLVGDCSLWVIVHSPSHANDWGHFLFHMLTVQRPGTEHFQNLANVFLCVSAFVSWILSDMCNFHGSEYSSQQAMQFYQQTFYWSSWRKCQKRWEMHENVFNMSRMTYVFSLERQIVGWILSNLLLPGSVVFFSHFKTFSIHEDGCDLLCGWIKKKKPQQSQTQNLTKNGEPQRYSWEYKRRRRRTTTNIFPKGFVVQIQTHKKMYNLENNTHFFQFFPHFCLQPLGGCWLFSFLSRWLIWSDQCPGAEKKARNRMSDSHLHEAAFNENLLK